MPDLSQPAGWLPLVFMVLMGLSMLIYVVLDGYDLGVGIMLLRTPDERERDTMISSIGPFWDANETWLVLGVGILLVAFPQAHGVILGALYLPVAFMLVGLTMRGVAFDFRFKAQAAQKPLWDKVFSFGSMLAAFSQGMMLAALITGFQSGPWIFAFELLIGGCLVAAYALLGSGWLIMKTEGDLQLRAVYWAKQAWGWTLLGIMAISAATPLVSTVIFQKWFAFPEFFLLLPIPVITLLCFAVMYRSLRRLPHRLATHNSYGIAIPFVTTVAIFGLAFYGLAYSLFPWLVIDRLSIWQAASSPEALMVIFYGVVLVLPVILAYTVFSYRVFWGKTKLLSY